MSETAVHKCSWLLGLSAALASWLAVVVPARASQAGAPCADPAILIDHSAGPGVTLMCTGHGFPTRSATSLGRLSNVLPHPAFAARGWPEWATGGFWAPDLEQVGTRYLLYFSARRTGDGRRCIGVAVSRRPNRGFRDVGHPLIDDEPDGAIDPALLIAGDQLFLFYKRDGNSVRAPSVILGRRLTVDGLRVAGPRVELLRSRRGGREHGVIEGPAPVHFGDTTYLLYSEGAFYKPGYAEGEALRSGDPLGPYHRIDAASVLRGGNGWVGTGGGSIVLDGSRLLLAYAAFRPRERPPRRFLFLRPLSFVGGILRPVGPARLIRLSGP